MYHYQLAEGDRFCFKQEGHPFELMGRILNHTGNLFSGVNDDHRSQFLVGNPRRLGFTGVIFFKKAASLYLNWTHDLLVSWYGLTLKSHLKGEGYQSLGVIWSIVCWFIYSIFFKFYPRETAQISIIIICSVLCCIVL